VRVVDGSVAILKLDHPEVMNAVSMDMLGGLGDALDAVDDRRSDVRCLVLTGAGRAFCAGANLQGRDNQKSGRSDAGKTLETGYHPFLRRLRNLHCRSSPINARRGAGMSFALMGDMILARAPPSCKLAFAGADRPGWRALRHRQCRDGAGSRRRRWNGVWSIASMMTRC
jgi:enoyl-CoA hydratase/carnithine racemase